MEKKRILLIDDDGALLRWMKLALERTGNYEVASEQNGAAALQTARSFKPQIIFIDLNMPNVEGSTLAHEIRSDSAFKRIPIVFLTGAVTIEEVERSGGKIGGEFFLAKPIDVARLVKCIGERLGS